MLNSRALNALQQATQIADERSKQRRRMKRVSALWQLRVHSAPLSNRGTVQQGAYSPENMSAASIQLLSHLCHYVPDGWLEPCVHCWTARPQYPGVADDLRKMAIVNY